MSWLAILALVIEMPSVSGIILWLPRLLVSARLFRFVMLALVSFAISRPALAAMVELFPLARVVVNFLLPVLGGVLMAGVGR